MSQRQPPAKPKGICTKTRKCADESQRRAAAGVELGSGSGLGLGLGIGLGIGLGLGLGIGLGLEQKVGI